MLSGDVLGIFRGEKALNASDTNGLNSLESRLPFKRCIYYMHIVKGLRILNSTQTVAMTGFGVVEGPNNPHFFNIRIRDIIQIIYMTSSGSI